MYFTSCLVHSIFLQEISQYFGNQVLRSCLKVCFSQRRWSSVYVDGMVLNGNTFSFILKELKASWLTLCKNKSIAISTGENYIKLKTGGYIRVVGFFPLNFVEMAVCTIDKSQGVIQGLSSNLCQGQVQTSVSSAWTHRKQPCGPGVKASPCGLSPQAMMSVLLKTCDTS